MDNKTLVRDKRMKFGTIAVIGVIGSFAFYGGLILLAIWAVSKYLM